MKRNTLRRVRAELDNLQSLREQREMIFARLTSVTAPIKEVDVQTSGTGDQMADQVPELAEYTDKINAKIREICILQIKAEKIIDSLPITIQAITREYYLQGKSKEQVAESLHYSESYVNNVVWRVSNL